MKSWNGLLMKQKMQIYHSRNLQCQLLHRGLLVKPVVQFLTLLQVLQNLSYHYKCGSMECLVTFVETTTFCQCRHYQSWSNLQIWRLHLRSMLSIHHWLFLTKNLFSCMQWSWEHVGLVGAMKTREFMSSCVGGLHCITTWKGLKLVISSGTMIHHCILICCQKSLKGRVQTL